MVMQFPQSETTDGITVNLGETDVVFVASNVFIASTDNVAIRGTGSNHQAIIEGVVATGSNGTVQLGNQFALDSGQTVEISASGEVRHFSNFSAVATLGADSAVNNDGLVTSTGIGIFMDGNAAALTNSGKVLSDAIAVVFGANTPTSLLNNSGLIEGDSGAFYGSTGTEKIINSGKMVGSISFFGGDDVYLGGEGRHDGKIFGGDGNDRITGGVDKDHFEGGAHKDTLEGGKGGDVLKGGSGNDKLYGGAGNDKLFGGNGNDKLSGGKSNDVLKGGAGNDRFVFAKNDGNDTIADFQDGSDRIDLKVFNFASKAEARSHFFEIGSGSNDKLGFDHEGTSIVVKGIDMGDLGGADLLI